jgi:hypothetical protein
MELTFQGAEGKSWKYLFLIVGTRTHRKRKLEGQGRTIIDAFVWKHIP